MSTATRAAPLVPAHYRIAAVLAGGVLARLALFASPLPGMLERRPELTSPITSVRSLREGTFLYKHTYDPYAGGVFFHSPLYLLFFAYAVPIESALLSAGLWTLVDAIGAVTLVQIWRTRQPAASKWSGRDHIVALLYLFNPYTLLSCLARSTTSLDNAMVLYAIASTYMGRGGGAMAALALATQTSLYPVILLPPLLLVLKQLGAPTSKLLSYALVYAGTLGVLAGLATAACTPSWVARTWGVILSASDLTPNVGMWWYFFTEMFDHFRTFFRGVFQLHMLIYIAPLCLRLPDPRQAVLILVGAMATWKSYPTLGDMALWAGLLSCYPDYVSNLNHPLFSLTVHLYTAILLPLLHTLWLLTGAGNANFFYAATMVYGLNATLAIADVLGAMISLDTKRQLMDLIPGKYKQYNPPADSGEVIQVDFPPNWTVTQLASLE
ncbi:PIG-U-domain-containing protein [Cutaneotrichosporon oleaginosum]|uniref:PIG-U-domain-containing protein n=1 Tax=Cutaneotrichosporon oleaginosum TaxID=879819 RepID=A0A0J0XWH7_9TREE|nr:PIG-U-domain-containing protein [Cutaneotrichosporon oleaginosum]KLT45415.1 PIG-U-domain-containing protein [Cutaneotrichosporon oleaginosum]